MGPPGRGLAKPAKGKEYCLWQSDNKSSMMINTTTILTNAAIDVHLSLRGKMLLPIHWGTFNIGIHAWTDPVEKMIKAATKKSVNFVVPMPGQPVSPDKPFDLKKWWLKSMS